MEHLLRLLHHVKPEREWQRDIKEELDEIAREIDSSKKKIRQIAKARMEVRMCIPRTVNQQQVSRPTSEVLRIDIINEEK